MQFAMFFASAQHGATRDNLSRTMTLNLPSLTPPPPPPPLFLGETIHVLRPRSFLCSPIGLFLLTARLVSLPFLHWHGRYLSSGLLFFSFFPLLFKARRRNKLVLLRHPKVAVAARGGG